jgi:YVTN family beta-propeller protein
VWVLTQGNFSTLQRIDPRTNRVTGSVPLGYGDTSGNDSGEGAIAAADGSLWVAEYFYNTVLRIDPARLGVTHTIKVGRSPSGIVAADGSIFVSDSHASAVSRIDPRTNRVVATIPVGDTTDFNGGPFYLTYTAGRVWTIVPAEQRLYAIDPRTDRVVAKPSVAPAIACGRLDPVPGAIWIDDQNCSNTFSRYDLVTGHVTQIQEPSTMCLLGIAVLHGRLYSDEMTFDPSVGCGPGSFVPRDLTTGAVLGAGTPIDVVGFEVAGIDGSLWTNDFSTGNHVLRITPERTS